MFDDQAPWDTVEELVDSIEDFVEDVEEIVEDIEEVIANFRGYVDPFFYSRKKDQRQHGIPKPMMRVTTNPGTKPDMEVRWKH